jgi:apolipoprotein N-acyltransferase
MDISRLRLEQRRWPLRVAALLAGSGFALIFPESPLWWWAYVGLVPVLLLIRAAPDMRESLWRTWAAACGFFVTLHYWLVPSLTVFTVPLVVLMGLVWLPWGAPAWRLLRTPPTLGRAATAVVVLPSVWVLTEYVRSWEVLGGSWGHIGASQWQARPILAVAALGGVWAISFLLVATNVALLLAVTRGVEHRTRVGAGALAILLVVAAASYGLTRPEPDVTGELSIGGVQPGVVHDPTERYEENERITRELLDLDLDMIVWGQSSVGFDLATTDWVRERVTALADEAGIPVLINVDARLPDDRISKITVVIRPEEGPSETYVKQRLVPFGEYIPARSVFGWLEDITEAADEDRVPGTDFTTFELAGTAVGPLISYESTFPDIRRTLAREDVEMTLVQAAATTFQNSWALPQQASFEAVRAVESGRPAVLVSVSGQSTAFDPRGRQLASVSQHYTGPWTVDVPLSQEDTLFVRWGDWVPAMSLFVVLVAATWLLAGRWRRHAGGSPGG